MVAVIMEVARWTLAFGFLGILISIGVQFHAFSSAQKKKYKVPLIIAIILIAIATLVQMALIGVPS
ncbi:MAG: hypothetical protein FJ005_07615 [Chloroflexi bacterium]|nr:hypothetical protein [Chloroflexota bacterium]